MTNESMAFENEQERTNESIHSLIQQLVGPEMSGMLEAVLNKVLGSAFRNNMPGGGTFSSGGIFTQNNVGLSALDAQQRRMEARMERDLDRQYSAERNKLLEAAASATGGSPTRPGVWGAPLIGAGAMMGSGLLTSIGKYGFVGGLAAYAQDTALDESALRGGIRYGRRAMGAGSAFGLTGEAAVRKLGLTDSVKAIETALQKDYVQNFEQYRGIGGRRVGQLYAEAARVGAISASTDPQQVTALMRGLSGNFDPMKTFFGGNIMQGYDATNTLLGVNAMATFGSQLGGMYSGLRAMGQVAGYSPEYSLAMVQRQAQLASAMGGPQFAAIANATIAGTYMSSIQRGVGLSWVSEAGMRDTILQRVLGASAGTLTRAIAGAGVQMTAENRKAFEAELRSRGGVLTEDVVAQIANQKKYGAIGTAMDLIARGSSHDARTLIAQGFGTDIALGSNISAMEGTFRGEAERVMGADFMRRVQGPVTLESLNAAAANEAERIKVARLNSIFNTRARSYGYRDADEASKMIQIQRQEKARAYLDQSIKEGRMRVDWDQKFSNYGKVSGLGGVVKALQAMDQDKDGAAGMAGRTMLEWVMGLDDRSVGTTIRGMDKSLQALDKMATGAGDEFGMSVYQFVPEMLQSATLGGKKLTAEQNQLLKDIAAAGGDERKLAGLKDKIAALSKGASKKQRLAYLSAKKLQLLGKDTASDQWGKFEDEASTLARLDVLESSEIWKNTGGKDKEVLEVMQRQKQMLEAGKQTEEIDDALKSMKGYSKYEQAQQKAWESNELKEYGVTSGLDIGEKILKLLEGLFEHFTNKQG